MPVATVNGFEMYYQVAGTGEPVVYVHGGFPSLESALLDFAGMGLTGVGSMTSPTIFSSSPTTVGGVSGPPAQWRGFELADSVRDLELLLDELELSSAHLVGSSGGGPIAILFAATKARRTRSLTLAGTASNLLRSDDDVAKVVIEQIAHLTKLGPEAAFDRRPDGVEVSLGVLWEPPERAERGTLDEYWRPNDS